MSKPAQAVPLYDITLTDDELTFLTWALGYLYGASEKMSEGRRNYIGSHHFNLLPKLLGANKRPPSND